MAVKAPTGHSGAICGAGSVSPGRQPVTEPLRASLEVFVPGTPVPKGSTRSFVVNGHAVTTAANKGTKPWQAQVAAFVREATGPQILFPKPLAVSVRLTFVMPRRAAEPKRITPAHTRKPDIDKLTRAVFDALSGLAYEDDAQVVTSWSFKNTAAVSEQPGVHIAVQHVSAVVPDVKAG